MPCLLIAQQRGRVINEAVQSHAHKDVKLSYDPKRTFGDSHAIDLLSPRKLPLWKHLAHYPECEAEIGTASY